MKTIRSMYEQVKGVEVQQLKNKLHNWGYFYKFPDEEMPIVAASCFDEPTDVVVEFVEVLADGSLHIRCHTKDNPQESVFLDEDDVYYGHLDFITGSIPNKFDDFSDDEQDRLLENTHFDECWQRWASGDYWMNKDDYEMLKVAHQSHQGYYSNED